MTSILLATMILANPTQGLKLSVDGEGYFRILREGRIVYSPSVEVRVVQGQLVESTGQRLFGSFEGLTSTGKLNVSPDGTVTLDGAKCGRISLALLSARPIRSGDFWITSTRPIVALPGEKGAGLIVIGDQPKTVASGVVNAPPLTPPSSPTLRLKSNAIAAGDQILLKEIVEPNTDLSWIKEYGEIAIDLTPPVGIERKVSQDRVVFRLKQAGLDPKLAEMVGGASTVVVKREAMSIGLEQFEEAARKAITQILGNIEDLNLTSNFPAMELPKGQLELQARTPQMTSSKVTVTVYALIDGKRFNGRTLTFEIQFEHALPSVGATVTVYSKVGSVRIEDSGRVIKVDAAKRLITVELSTSKERVIGTLVGPNAVEVRL